MPQNLVLQVQICRHQLSPTNFLLMSGSNMLKLSTKFCSIGDLETQISLEHETQGPDWSGVGLNGLVWARPVWLKKLKQFSKLIPTC